MQTVSTHLFECFWFGWPLESYWCCHCCGYSFVISSKSCLHCWTVASSTNCTSFWTRDFSEFSLSQAASSPPRAQPLVNVIVIINWASLFFLHFHRFARAFLIFQTIIRFLQINFTMHAFHHEYRYFNNFPLFSSISYSFSFRFFFVICRSIQDGDKLKRLTLNTFTNSLQAKARKKIRKRHREK